MKRFFSCLLLLSIVACQPQVKENKIVSKTAEQILGNPNYTAISFGGFRGKTRNECPSVEDLKEDMKVLAAMDIKMLRTYNTQIYPHAERVLEAIHQLKQIDEQFEMYVMLGAWIECDGAFTETRNHAVEHQKQNEAEIQKAIKLAKRYPDIVKVIAVGNESMVHWAETYFVQPKVILTYVERLQRMKSNGELDSNLWITSSDNFASWGGGSADYYNEDLTNLIRAVDYISMHTYPFHDTHYNPEFWQLSEAQAKKSGIENIKEGMERAANYAIDQFEATKKYIHSIAPNKPIHIGETGWATDSKGFYGKNGSHAADEYKQKLYYDHLRNWSIENRVSCFFFEAFDEPWKDPTNEKGSENHFGLINIDSEAKYVLWDLLDSAKFDGLNRNGKAISKTFGGNEENLMKEVLAPVIKK